MSIKNRLVFQVDIDTGKRGDTMFSYAPQLYSYSSECAQRYAHRVGADYLLLRNSLVDVYDGHPAWQRYSMFRPDFDRYDTVLYLDSDVVVRSVAPNIFAAYPDDAFYAVPVFDSDPLPEQGRLASIGSQIARFGLDADLYFNSGVLMAGKRTRRVIRDYGWENRIIDYNREDQPTINKIVQATVGVSRMDARYNYLFKRREQRPEADVAHFVHFLAKSIFSPDMFSPWKDYPLEFDERDTANSAIGALLPNEGIDAASDQAWTDGARRLTAEILCLPSFNRKFVLLDEDQLGVGMMIGDRQRVPFFGGNRGDFGGAPEDDDDALKAVAALRGREVCLLIFAWPAFWWLAYYRRLQRYLSRNATCICRNERLVAFLLDK